MQTKNRYFVSNNRIEIKGRAGSGLAIVDAVAQAEAEIGPISGSGSFTGLGTKAIPGCAAGHFIEAIDIPVYAVHDCEVAVDPETGHIEILSYRVIQDVGRALNPRAIHSQIQGGVVQGLGYAIQEEITFDKDEPFSRKVLKLTKSLVALMLYQLNFIYLKVHLP